jgi:hypothetical protein
MVSAVATETGRSRYLTDTLAATGKSVWRSSASVTSCDELRVRSGQYLSIGLGRSHGLATAPLVDDALTFATTGTLSSKIQGGLITVDRSTSGEVRMQQQELGNGGLEVSALALGCMRVSQGHGPGAGTRREMIPVMTGAV